jgi:hypothetical protein
MEGSRRERNCVRVWCSGTRKMRENALCGNSRYGLIYLGLFAAAATRNRSVRSCNSFSDFRNNRNRSLLLNNNEAMRDLRSSWMERIHQDPETHTHSRFTGVCLPNSRFNVATNLDSSMRISLRISSQGTPEALHPEERALRAILSR